MEKKNILKKIKNIFLFFISISIFIIILIIFPVRKIRIGILDSSRLGHLLENYSYYLLFKKKNTLDFWIQIYPICNKFLYTSLKKKMKIYENSKAKILFFVLKLSKLFFGRNNIFEIHTHNRIHRKFWNKINNKIKLINFSEEDIKSCKAILKRYVNYKKKIALIQIRDDGYLSKNFGKKKHKYHSYRNANIRDYVPAIKYLIKKGYFVIRVGRNNKNKLTLNNKNYFDYSVSKIVSDILDFYLVKICNIAICNNVGWEVLPTFFGKKVIFSNGVYMYATSFGSKFWIIFKKLRDKKNKKINLRQQILKKYHCFNRNDQFKNNNLKLISNKPSEILELTKEALDNNYRNKIRSRKILKMEKELKKLLMNDCSLNNMLKNKKKYNVPWNFGSKFLNQNF